MYKHDDALALVWESILSELIALNSSIEADEDDEPMLGNVDDVRTFRDAHLCTTDRGLVIDIPGGEINLTIQAYSIENG